MNRARPDAIRQKLEETMSDPRLPAGARQRLLGQRPGATSQGLRNQHAPTRSFVPADLGRRVHRPVESATRAAPQLQRAVSPACPGLGSS